MSLYDKEPPGTSTRTADLATASNCPHYASASANRMAPNPRHPGRVHRMDSDTRRSLSRAAAILSKRMHTVAISIPPEILLLVYL